MSSKEAPAEFIQKIKDKMAVENIGVSQLARKLNVSHPTVIEVVTYGKKPSFDTAVALAKWFNQSEVSILRESGLLPPGPRDEATWEDWKHLLVQLTPTEEEEMREIAIGKIKRREKEQSLKSLKPKKVR